MLKKFLLASVGVLALAGVVRADFFTTNVRIQPPAMPGPQSGVVAIDGPTGGGRIFANQIGAPVVGNVVREIGATPVSTFTYNNGLTGFASTPGHQLVAVV